MSFAERKSKSGPATGRVQASSRSKDAVALPTRKSATCACGGGCPRCSGTKPSLQAKRAISEPGDPLERQADQTAEQVMRMPDAGAISMTTGAPAIARKVGDAAAPPPREAPSAVHDVLASPGQALDAGTRGFFEPRFGYDLSGVRVHADAADARAARAINAQAFTHGRDIVFDSGAYQPDSDSGRRLLAHELTHVLQQQPGGAASAGTLQRTAYSDCNEEQLPSVRSATRTAVGALGTALSRLRQRPLTQHVSDALWLMFRDRSERMANYAQAVLGEVHDGLPGATIECEQPEDLGYGMTCREDVGGYVRIGSMITGIGNIHLCMGEWENKSDAKRMHMVLHEAAHLHARTDDYGYFNAEDCTETDESAAAATTTPVGITPVTRSNNADCYACLARMLGVMSAQEVADRVGLYQGDTLVIRQSPPGEVDLNGSEQSTAFVMGIPSADDPMRMDMPSTFELRWVLWDPQGNEYDMQGLFGGPVRSFGRGQGQVIIPAATRALLRQRGVTHGTLYCRYRMEGVGQRLFWLPVRFTSDAPDTGAETEEASP